MRVGIVALGALYGTACVLPQEDTVLGDLTLKNRPPRIVEDQTKLNGTDNARQDSVGNGPDCAVETEAFVEDPDVNDLITFRWYVDYDPQNPDRQLPLEESTLAPTTGTALRTPSVKFRRPTENNPRFAPGTHVITLMVFDGHLLAFQGPGSVPEADAVPGSTARNPHYSTTFNWIVTVDPTLVCTP